MPAINIPNPTRNGIEINRMFISGIMRANTAKTTKSSKNAASIGPANRRLAISITEPDLTIPSSKNGIVGILPEGNAS